MNFVLELITPPDDEPVSLVEMKTHLREFDSITADVESQISGLIKAAREWAEDYTGRALMEQAWRLTVDNVRRPFNSVAGPPYGPPGPPYMGIFQPTISGELYLRRAPVIAVTSFVQVDDAGVETAFDAATYQLREKTSKWPRILPINTSWLNGTFKIEFTAGFDDEDLIPFRFKQAIKLYAEALYDRDPIMMPKLIAAAEGLLGPEKADLNFA